MKKTVGTILPISLALMFLGCATSSIESRKKERYDAYSGLSEETRGLVDAGEIKVGMTEDAVYIAWGKPTEILQSESQSGTTVTWLYHGTYLEQHRYWRHDTFQRDRRGYNYPYLAHDYHPRTYVTARIQFRDGKVAEWKTLPQPH